MPQPTSKTAEPKGPSPLRLRVGVAFILMWWFPFWAFAPAVTDALKDLSNPPPSVAAVTATIVVLQTLVGLLGFWVAGTQVKAIVKGSSKRRALKTIWSVFLHGRPPAGDGAAATPDSERPSAGG